MFVNMDSGSDPVWRTICQTPKSMANTGNGQYKHTGVSALNFRQANLVQDNTNKTNPAFYCPSD